MVLYYLLVLGLAPMLGVFNFAFLVIIYDVNKLSSKSGKYHIVIISTILLFILNCSILMNFFIHLFVVVFTDLQSLQYNLQFLTC
jgi:hypothetical protein